MFGWLWSVSVSKLDLSWVRHDIEREDILDLLGCIYLVALEAS